MQTRIVGGSKQTGVTAVAVVAKKGPSAHFTAMTWTVEATRRRLKRNASTSSVFVYFENSLTTTEGMRKHSNKLGDSAAQ